MSMEDNEKYHSDDGSYELVDYDEYISHISDSAESQSQGNITLTECSDLEADVASDLDNANELSDGSYEFVHSEEANNHDLIIKDEADNHISDSDQEDPSDALIEEITHQSFGTESSSDMEPEDGFDMMTLLEAPSFPGWQGEGVRLRTVTYQKADDNVFDFPPNIKRKEHREIKDVVKDHVLPFLPAKSLVKFKIVSKEWDKWITSPFLAHKQAHFFRKTSGFFREYSPGIMETNASFITLDQSAYGVPSPALSFLPEIVTVKSSCNGLLLCQGSDAENVYYICNPANEEWSILPPPEYYHGDKPKIVLAFEPSSLNFEAYYQVVCPIALPLFDGPIVLFDIYNSMTRSWKVSTIECVEIGDYSGLKDNALYVNGVAYWETSAGELLAFDLKNEICGILPLPPERTSKGVLSQMHGELCYMEAYYRSWNTYIVDIYSGALMSSKRSIAIDLPLGSRTIETGTCRVLPCVSSDVLALLTEDYLVAYHVSNRKVEVTRVSGISFSEKYFPYVNSLVSVASK